MPDLTKALIRIVRRTLKQGVSLARLLPWKPRSDRPGHVCMPRKILLLHPGHLGDMVISTSILGPLERCFPGIEVGFVTGSWSAGALQNVRGVSTVHILDHWRLNRSASTLWGKWRRYQQTRASALKSIRAQHYEAAISLLDVNPDLLDLAWAAGIPVRVGWRSSYFAALATRLVTPDEHTLRHQAVRQAQTLLALGIERSQLENLQSRVVDDTPAFLAELRALFPAELPKDTRFRIIHMGAGAPMKQMPDSFWRHVVEALSPAHVLVFTGRGTDEQAHIQTVTQGLPNCINACDRLSWAGFVSTIRAAEMLYGVDSMAGHVAAAVDTPVVAAYQGAGGVSRWRPFHPSATVLTSHLACAPCLLPNGCATMPCKAIDPEEMLAATPVAPKTCDTPRALQAPLQLLSAG